MCVSAQTCSAKKTRTDMLGPFYVPKSPRTRTIGPVSETSNPKKRLKVTGRILSTRSCGVTSTTKRKLYYPVSNINVEVWYAGTPDSDGNFYQTKKYRGQTRTGKCGYFSFVQVFPEIYPDRPIIHTHIRLSDNANKQLLVTQVYYKGPDEGYYNDDTVQNVLGNDEKELQALKVKTAADGTRSVVFDVFLDVDGNKECKQYTSSVQPRRLI